MFVQDGALLHIAPQVTELLRVHFGNGRAISRNFQTVWLPRSPDLKPCIFWLWKFLENNVYKGNIQIVPELKASITRHVSSVDQEALRTTVEHAITVLNT